MEFIVQTGTRPALDTTTPTRYRYGPLSRGLGPWRIRPVPNAEDPEMRKPGSWRGASAHAAPFIAVAFTFAACGGDDGQQGGDGGGGGDADVQSGPETVIFDTATDGELDTGLDAAPDDAGEDTRFDPDTVQPGEFGAPCIENIDCFSGWCITSDRGPICTRECVEDCPADFNCLGITNGVDLAFLCVPRQDRLCQPCALDGQCGTGYCMPLTEGNRCTTACDEEGECPSGYTCEEVTSALNPGLTSLQCVPNNDACDCVPGKEGFVEACQTVNAFGACTGLRTCQGLAGWGPCDAPTASPEVCDGEDNNCNRLIDENLTGDTCDITNAFGTCTGLRVCDAADGVTCVGQTPAAETCNYLDDDCDGETDDGFRVGGRYVADTGCGNCFTNCVEIFDRPNAFGTCDTAPETPTCRMECDPNYFDLNAVPDDGCEFLLDSDAIHVSVADATARDQQGCGLGPTGTLPGAYPCRSIGFGLGEAARLGRGKVLVADGLYLESVTLRAGIDLLGGHRADTWERDVDATNTAIRGPAAVSGHARTVIADGITVPTEVSGFVITGGSAFGASANSYAVWIRNSTAALALRDNLIFGGDAGDGADGAVGAIGSDGGNGQPGERAILTSTHNNCGNASNVPGNVPNCFNASGNLVAGACGAGGTNTCGGTSVAGGAGRGAVCPSGNTRQGTGTNGSAASGGGSAGTGGAGGYDRSSNDCNNFGTGGFSATAAAGTNGGRGDDRAGGNGGAGSAGNVSGGHWSGNGGGGGQGGRAGGGGGGGGAGGGADVTLNCTSGGDTTDDSLGGSGGGGGAGGCGGGGGGAGGAGGGSFAVFVTWNTPNASAPTLSGNVITRGRGGAGGRGGPGGKGGRGGEGGAGGGVAGVFGFAMGVGGRGGQGGDGGHGGGGGGGSGGASYGVYVHQVNGNPGYGAANTFVPSGAGGPGGQGGASPGLAGQNGSDGLSADTNL